MKHKIVMIPAGYTKLDPAWYPEHAKLVGHMTEAGLIGTVWEKPDGSVGSIKGLLAEDKTFVIQDPEGTLLDSWPLYTCLKSGKVHKRTILGTLEYDVKASLIIMTQPRKWHERIHELFEVSEV